MWCINISFLWKNAFFFLAFSSKIRKTTKQLEIIKNRKTFYLLFFQLIFISHSFFSMRFIWVVLPSKDIEINGTKSFYQTGEILQANCTCYDSIPSALLEWNINNYPVSTIKIITYAYTSVHHMFTYFCIILHIVDFFLIHWTIRAKKKEKKKGK